MMRIKVSHVIRLSETPSSPPFSGAENHLLFLLPGLVSQDLEVELIVVYNYFGPIMQSAFKKLREKNVNIVLLPLATKTNWFFLGLLRLQRIVDLGSLLSVRKDHIIHLHLDYFGAPISAWIAGCKKVVMSIHNDEDWLGSVPMRIWLRFLNLIIKYYIAISDRVKNYFIFISGVTNKKIKRIYYGVAYKQSNLTRDELRRKYSVPINKKIVGFIGRLTSQKNIELLIKLAEKMPDTYFVIVGEGELRANLQNQAFGLKNVVFLGYQPNGFELMKMFDIFCLPSRYEGLGLVLVEAMLQSIPIVASRAGAIPEILQNGKFGLLFDPDDMNGLIENINYAFKSPEPMSLMVTQAKEFASLTFAMDKMIAETIKVYAEVN